MSVERRRRADGKLAYRVRYRQGGHNRARAFDRLRDAQLFDSEVRRRKQLGDLAALEGSRQTLNELADDWWRLYAEPNLAAKTRQVYRGVFDKQISPHLGGLRLNEITTPVVEAFVLKLQATGVKPAVVQKTINVLSSIMRKAVVWGRISTNPVAGVTKPRTRTKPSVKAIGPADVEAIRGGMNLRGATLVSVLAYAGLRPGEALALKWGDVGNRTILVERAASLGEVKDTKTRQKRTVEMVGPLAADLTRWKIASGGRGDDDLVFPRVKDGGVWTAGDWKNWRRARFLPAVKKAGLPSTFRPYDLRHSFCSMLIEEGRSVVEVARQMGHSPAMTLSTYAHVIDEHAGAPGRTMEEAIRAARSNEVVPPVYPRAVNE